MIYGCRKETEEKRLALAMALHPRLGQISPLAQLETELLVKCSPEIPMYDSDVDPAKDDPDEDHGLWELDEEQIHVYRMGGTWREVFSARAYW